LAPFTVRRFVFGALRGTMAFGCDEVESAVFTGSPF